MRSHVARAGLLALFCAFIGPRPAIAVDPRLVEIRRTFASPECDAGEIYVDGVLGAVYLAAANSLQGIPPFFVATGNVAPGELAFDNYWFKKTPSLTLSTDAGTFTVGTLVKANYAPFRPLRTRVSTPPPNVFFACVQLNLRECEVRASVASSPYGYQDDESRGDTRRALEALLRPSVSGASVPIVLAIIDRSALTTVLLGDRRIEWKAPAASATGVGEDSPCLTEFEDGRNTIISNAGRRYERRDRVVACTQGAMEGDPTSNHVWEWIRDVRHLHLTSAEVCARPLGIPINREYVLARRPDGSLVSGRSFCGSVEVETAPPTVEFQ